MGYQLLVYMFLLATIIGWGLWGFFSKMGISAVGVYTNIFVIYLSGWVTIAILGFFTLPHGQISLTKELIYPIFGGVAMGIGSVAFFSLIQKYNVSLILPLTFLYLIVTTVLSIALLHEHLKPTHIIGIALMLTAAFLISQ